MSAVEIIDLNQIEKENTKQNVCAYARVSTTKELQATSLNLQVETYTKMIHKNPDWNFSGVFFDVGKSGTDTKHRTQFNQMIDLAKAGGIDLIITKSISRFARNTVDCLRIIQDLKRYKVEVWFEKENISSFDPKVELTMTIYASVAEEEAKINSENTLWGVKKRFEDGIVPMVTSKVLGYKRDKDNNIIVDELEAKIVRKIFNLYAKGYSLYYIAEKLNDEGHKTKYKNLAYKKGAVRGILVNEKYTGNALLQKSKRKKVGDRNPEKNQQTHPKYYVENSHPKIITKALWDKVHVIRNQRMMKYNHTTDIVKLKERAKHKSIYSGFVQCGVCGKNYHFKVNNKKEKWATETLICASNREKKTCKNDALFVKTFEKQLLAHINNMIRNKYEFLNTLHEVLISHPEIRKLNIDNHTLEDKLDGVNEHIKSLVTIDSDFERKVLEELKDRKASLQADLTANRNKLLTSHNVETKLKQYKLLLKNFKKPISSLSDFPFKAFFDKAIVYSRDRLEFILNPFNADGDNCIYSFPEIITTYTIRKTSHESISKVSCM